jgi:hypothetical protein
MADVEMVFAPIIRSGRCHIVTVALIAQDDRCPVDVMTLAAWNFPSV